MKVELAEERRLNRRLTQRLLDSRDEGKNAECYTVGAFTLARAHLASKGRFTACWRNKDCAIQV